MATKNKAAAVDAPGVEPRFESADEIVGQLERDMKSPRSKFKGKMLAPYNRTYRDLALGVMKPTDPTSFFAWVMVYVLIRGEEIYQAAIARYNGNCEAAEDAVDATLPLEVEEDIEAFRFAIRKWARHFNDDDNDEAMGLIVELKKRGERADVKVTKGEKDEGAPGKSRQRRQR